ncbi:MAG: heme o synthase [Kiritimatiellae bacterium]|nr:heme o synthase [Kiritimatiellia bacterium]MDW8459094.1 heme o synthase [Verrucomicrobiota bacterium]
MAMLAALWELSKPRIVGMVLVTTASGFFLGADGRLTGEGTLALLSALFGTGLAAAGAAALNNFLERDADARMERTRKRALPAGHIEPAHALAYGILLVLGGVAWLAGLVNLLSAFLVLLTAFLYVLVYTPLKRVTWLNTSIGAIPGALPPMVGWAAATDGLHAGAWILFVILYLWQHPHFYAISWMYREDYRAAGFKMLANLDPSGCRLFRHAIFFSLVLIPASIALSAIGLTGSVYLAGSVFLGAALLAAGLHLAQHKRHADARRVLLASVAYLPLLFGLMVLDVAFLR